MSGCKKERKGASSSCTAAVWQAMLLFYHRGEKHATASSFLRQLERAGGCSEGLSRLRDDCRGYLGPDVSSRVLLHRGGGASSDLLKDEVAAVDCVRHYDEWAYEQLLGALPLRMRMRLHTWENACRIARALRSGDGLGRGTFNGSADMLMRGGPDMYASFQGGVAKDGPARSPA